VKAWFGNEGVTTKWLPDNPVNENSPFALVTVLFETSHERKTCTPVSPVPPEVIDPRNVMFEGGGGSVGLPPLQAARKPRAAATAGMRKRDLVFMVAPSFGTFSVFPAI
jgi:hypothetical protein